MINLNSYCIKYLTIILFLSVAFTNLFAQNKIIERTELKKTLRFDEWKGKNHGVTNGINLSTEKIPVLSVYTEIKHKYLFFISQQEDGQSFVKYRSKWKSDDLGFVEITLSFLNSGLEAHEYLIDEFISTVLPPEAKMNSRDIPNVVGDISFYQGRTFIRDNIVVNVHTEGELTTKVKEIVQKIDEIILTHKTFQTENKVRPYIIVDNNGQKTIVEP